MTQAASMEWWQLHKPTINVVTSFNLWLWHCVLPVDSLLPSLLTVRGFTMRQSLTAHGQAHEKDVTEVAEVAEVARLRRAIHPIGVTVALLFGSNIAVSPLHQQQPHRCDSQRGGT